RVAPRGGAEIADAHARRLLLLFLPIEVLEAGQRRASLLRKAERRVAPREVLESSPVVRRSREHVAKRRRRVRGSAGAEEGQTAVIPPSVRERRVGDLRALLERRERSLVVAEPVQGDAEPLERHRERAIGRSGARRLELDLLPELRLGLLKVADREVD